jgi:hypothetical protein
MTLARPRLGFAGLLYLGIGLAIAASHTYFDNVHSLKTFGSAVFAIVLWPLVLLGIDLHIRA